MYLYMLRKHQQHNQLGLIVTPKEVIMKIFNTKLYILEEMTQEELNELALERNTLQQRIDKAIPMLDELEKKIQEILSFKIPITEIKQIKEILKGEE